MIVMVVVVTVEGLEGVIVMVVMVVVVVTVEELKGALVVGRVVLLPWVTYKFNLHYHRFKIETYCLI